MEAHVPDRSVTDTTSSWGVHGDPALLVEAARKLRLGIEMGVYRSHPPGEYAMFSRGAAARRRRVLDAHRWRRAPHRGLERDGDRAPRAGLPAPDHPDRCGACVT
jgi:hypothetical protein